MARATPGQGPYTKLPPQDRSAELRWVQDEVRAIRYPDADDITALDWQIANKRVQWESTVDDEYTRRKQALTELIREEEGRLAPRNRTVHEAAYRVAAAESARARLAERFQSPHGTPGKAVQRVGETEPPPPLRTYDEDGLPVAFTDTGFSWGTVGYGIALLIAAAADIAGFYQVLALLLGSWPWILIILVVTCAIGSLFLMHKAGTEFKKFRDQGRLWVSCIAIGTWFILGAGAFTVRFRTEDDSAATGAFAVLTGPPAFAAEEAWVKATVFLVVYIASGVLALIGGYATYDRARTRYKRANASVARRHRQLARAEKKRNRVVTTILRIQDELDQERERWANARKEREAFAAGLVALVAIEIRKRVDDPDERARIDETDANRLKKMKLEDLNDNKKASIEEDEAKFPTRTAEELMKVGTANTDAP